jgi:squalene monooxygenase
MSLYSLFAAQSDDMMVLQNGCFEYFKLGGDCVDGPINLLSGIAQSPLSLIYHFFMVAFYSIYVMFRDGGLGGIPQNIVQSFTVFYTACVVILPFLWGEFKG